MGLANDSGKREGMANRVRFFRTRGIKPSEVVLPRQVHGARIAIIQKIPRRGFVPSTDALVTNQPNTFLAILSADCFPVFFYDEGAGVVGITHAGWRGVVKGIIPGVVRILQRRYRLHAASINVAIGPGIQKCHYEVWPKKGHRGMAAYARVHEHFLQKRGRRTFADLEGIIRGQLRQEGILSRNIYHVGECTYHMPTKYFSYRRDANAAHPRGFGNMISVIGIKKK